MCESLTHPNAYVCEAPALQLAARTLAKRRMSVSLEKHLLSTHEITGIDPDLPETVFKQRFQRKKSLVNEQKYFEVKRRMSLIQ